ncbi:MAG TPA: ABC transporter ATP-binding protein [Bacteroidales bacterium]|nr:ABC transporter ATP-binding protein [Bacteroidales bacterium]
MAEIEINNLYKSYGDVKALDNVCLSVEKNGFCGLIGPDGAGKTTLMRVITSLLVPDSGEISIGGLDPIKEYKKLRLKLGYMPGKFSLYQDLSVEENLRFFAGVFGTSIKENYHLIKNIYSHIEPFKNRRAGKLSGGMKQKLALSCALIHKPEILILDEPTTGVDAVSRREFWEMLGEIRNYGITILVSTPYMEEAVLCDQVSLLFDGKVVESGTPKQIVERFSSTIFAVKTVNIPASLKVLRNMEDAKSVNSFGQNIHVVFNDGNHSVEQITNYLIKNNITDAKVSIINAGIEDCFIDYIIRQNKN